MPARSPSRGAPLRRRGLLAALGALLVLLFVLVELMLLHAYGDTERTTRDFQGATDATTAIANAQREVLLLGNATTQLDPGESMTQLQIRRGLLERQLEVTAAATRRHGDLLAAVRAQLRQFDAAVTSAFGDGPRARRSAAGKAHVQAAFRRLDRQIKHIFDEEEHALYAALRHTLDNRAQDQLLLIVLSTVALLVAALMAVAVSRAVRGRFARAYRMLDRSEARLHRLVAQLPAIVYALAPDEQAGTATTAYVSPQVEPILGVSVEEALDRDAIMARIPEADRGRVTDAIARAVAGGAPEPVEFRFRRPDGRELWLRDTGAALTDGLDGPQLQGLVFDVTAEKEAQAERAAMELELRLAQKLEAVGQLAAGIAHEINTPIQFVGDTVGFLQGAFEDLLSLQEVQARVRTAAAAGAVPAELLDEADEAAEIADVDYLRARVPVAFERARDGISRVGTIVGAMREFAHPPTAERAPVDINQALQNTLIVTANTYKYVADIDLDLGELPSVVCNDGDINQVFLNLIVNAAQAIEDRGDGERGTIRIRTRAHGDHALITIADTGCGIPADVAARVFDPFFTTKEVGRGTGQGLAIARTLVVERHGGTLTFETDPGAGTTFHIRLPLDPDAAAPVARSA